MCYAILTSEDNVFCFSFHFLRLGLTKEGNLVDSRVEAFAIGLQMGLKFAKDAAKDAISTLQASLPLDGSSVRTGFGAKQF